MDKTTTPTIETAILSGVSSHTVEQRQAMDDFSTVTVVIVVFSFANMIITIAERLAQYAFIVESKIILLGVADQVRQLILADAQDFFSPNRNTRLDSQAASKQQQTRVVKRILFI